jgi:hypothetical protein
MRHRVLARSLVSGLVAVMAMAALAFADTLAGDADLLTAGAQTSRYLGEVGPGAVIQVAIDFRLTCKGLSHVDPGQSVLLTVSSITVPEGGSATATDGVVGPVPSTWADDTSGSASCPSPAPAALTASTPSVATLVAPATPGGPYDYSFMFDRTLSPTGVNDDFALTSLTAVSFSLTVVANTPPALVLPADATHEGNAPGGWLGAWSAPATDAEDDPPPSATCVPAPGSVLPLGTSTVACWATDRGGLTTHGTFRVTVTDTTVPSLAGVPASIYVVTGGTAGVAVTYQMPTASDIVDPAPRVACAPSSGSVFPVGTTTVRCSATDASGNASTAQFSVSVGRLQAIFGAPIAPDDAITVRSGRTLPVRVAILRDGVADRSGPVTLRLTDLGSCSVAALRASNRARASLPGRPVGTSSGAPKLRFDAGSRRWVIELNLAAWQLTPGSCYRVDAVDRGLVAGGFTLTVAR